MFGAFRVGLRRAILALAAILLALGLTRVKGRV